MKILLVEDNSQKAQLITAAVKATCGQLDNSIEVTNSLADAIRLLNTIAFDLVILDLLIPYVRDGQPDGLAGLELVSQVRMAGSLNRNTAIVGLSAFPDEVDAFRSRFDKFGVLITAFDENGAWRATLANVLDNVIEQTRRPIALDYLIICALEEERVGYEATKIKKRSDTVIDGLNVHYGQIGEYTGAILRLSRIGLVAATRETSAALEIFQPRILCMSGICAGFSGEVELGQLVVASPAWEYQAGKWSTNGFEIAPEQIPLRANTRALIDHEISKPTFQQGEQSLAGMVIRPKQRYQPLLAPFVTGSAVVADKRRLAHIEKQHRKVAALDMETFGLYYAAHESCIPVEHYFSIKAVVDFADAEKGDDLHTYGCITSAHASISLIEVLLGAT